MSEILITSQTLPEGVCFTTEQERFNTFASFLSADLPTTFTAFNIGSATPSVDNQDKPWLKTNANGTFERLYTFSAGAWTSPHPIPASSNIRLLWAGASADLSTFDGGNALAVTPTTGSFWEVDADFTDKVPRGAGTVAVNTDATELSSGASATDKVRGIYVIKRSARSFYVV